MLENQYSPLKPIKRSAGAALYLVAITVIALLLELFASLLTTAGASSLLVNVVHAAAIGLLVYDMLEFGCWVTGFRR